MNAVRMAVLTQIDAERERQEQKFGVNGKTCGNPLMPADAKFRVLVEEVGEVAKELNDADLDRREPHVGSLRTELIQVAAVAVAWAESLS